MTDETTNDVSVEATPDTPVAEATEATEETKEAEAETPAVEETPAV